MEALKKYIKQIHPISAETLEVLLAQFSTETFIKGTYFAKEGNNETRFGILVKGVSRTFFRNNEGAEYNKMFNVAPSFIGAYSTLITGKENRINIEFLTDAEVLVTNYQQFISLYQKHPQIESLSRKLSENYFVQKEKREIELVTMDAEKRYEIFKQEFPNLDQLIPQYHIASYLGVSATQLSRIRRNLAGK
ncbi:MAG: Crp/Fnr family transcriptional regulator [Thalassobius sp.]|nr:Crp/Fnr family transcriptional regulator [Thalassovita sp.]